MQDTPGAGLHNEKVKILLRFSHRSISGCTKKLYYFLVTNEAAAARLHGLIETLE